jgi:hypothetical protein
MDVGLFMLSPILILKVTSQNSLCKISEQERRPLVFLSLRMLVGLHDSTKQDPWVRIPPRSIQMEEAIQDRVAERPKAMRLTQNLVGAPI